MRDRAFCHNHSLIATVRLSLWRPISDSATPGKRSTTSSAGSPVRWVGNAINAVSAKTPRLVRLSSSLFLSRAKSNNKTPKTVPSAGTWLSNKCMYAQFIAPLEIMFGRVFKNPPEHVRRNHDHPRLPPDHAGTPCASRNVRVLLPFLTSRASKASAAPILTFDPVTSI